MRLRRTVDARLGAPVRVRGEDETVVGITVHDAERRVDAALAGFEKPVHADQHFGVYAENLIYDRDYACPHLPA